MHCQKLGSEETLHAAHHQTTQIRHQHQRCHSNSRLHQSRQRPGPRETRTGRPVTGQGLRSLTRKRKMTRGLQFRLRRVPADGEVGRTGGGFGVGTGASLTRTGSGRRRVLTRLANGVRILTSRSVTAFTTTTTAAASAAAVHARVTSAHSVALR